MWRVAHWSNISMGIEILCILNVFDTTQVYNTYVDLASFSRRVSAREPCGQFWDENEKLCWALASILLGSRCPEKHSIESKCIGHWGRFQSTCHFFQKYPNPPFLLWELHLLLEKIRFSQSNLLYCRNKNLALALVYPLPGDPLRRFACCRARWVPSRNLLRTWRLWILARRRPPSRP